MHAAILHEQSRKTLGRSSMQHATRGATNRADDGTRRTNNVTSRRVHEDNNVRSRASRGRIYRQVSKSRQRSRDFHSRIRRVRIIANRNDKFGRTIGIQRLLIPNTQMRIVGIQEDNLGKNLISRQMGEIYIRGPQVMKGYYKNPQATADTMDGDWYKTGDLGYYCEDGLYVKARLKEMIKVKGFQVAPPELEEVIRGNDKVQDVAVIGVAHAKYDEIPKAFVVPKPGVKINEDEIKEYVAERVAKFKHLGYVQFVESIPKNPSGKILRKELAKL